MVNTAEETVEIESGKLVLEGKLRLAPDGRRGLVLCHPHTLFGGTMDNNLVAAIAEGARKVGFSTLRFTKIGLYAFPPAGVEVGTFFCVFRKTRQALKNMVGNIVLHGTGKLLRLRGIDTEYLSEEVQQCLVLPRNSLCNFQSLRSQRYRSIGRIVDQSFFR